MEAAQRMERVSKIKRRSMHFVICLFRITELLMKSRYHLPVMTEMVIFQAAEGTLLVEVQL